MFEDILHRIKEYSTIIIHRHEKPDGDAMGSQLGLREILRENFPEKKVYVVGDTSRFLSFMKGAVMDEIDDSVYENALAVILDCGSHHLVSDNRYTLAAHTVRIDHHLFSENFADEEVVDQSYESCCGMITDFAIESGLKVNVAAANALFAGLVTDTGRFRYDSTDARSFRLAAFLMEVGVDTNELYRGLYADSYENKKLRAEFTMKIRFTEHGVAYIYTTGEELARMGADAFAISRGMVGVMSEMKGVGLWVNFTESETGILCELRSDDVSVNPIAVKYGGGGHKKASGATVPDFETAMKMLADLDELAAQSSAQ